MQNITFTTASQDSGMRLDKYLSAQLADMTRSFLQKLIKEGYATVDSMPQKANYKLKADQQVAVFIPKAQESEIVPEDIPLAVLYEDEELLVVNKPKGMVVHPSAGHFSGTLVNAVMYYCKDSLSGINGTIRPGIVHRIDKDTTGSLVICKTDESHVCIANQIKEHSIKRIYRGIVSGHMRQAEGRIEGNIGRHPKDRKKMAVVPKGGKPAVTHYKVLEQWRNSAYLEFRLETGRTHQIRVHMAGIGHPLLGDTVYGSTKNPYHLQGQALHAMTIGFLHPKTGAYLEVTAPLPDYFTELAAKLKK